MVMPLIHHTLPAVVATGVTARVAEKAIGSTRAKARRKPVKRRVPVVATKRKRVVKTLPRRRPVTTRRVTTKLPPGKWVQLSREELVHLVGKVKADKVKVGAGKAVKIGMYDKAVYINGKYYLNIS